MPNSDSRKKKFGPAEILDGAIIPTTQSYSRVPGSRGDIEDFTATRAKERQKGQLVLEKPGGVSWAGNAETTWAKTTTNYRDKKEGGIYKLKKTGEATLIGAK